MYIIYFYHICSPLSSFVLMSSWPLVFSQQSPFKFRLNDRKLISLSVSGFFNMMISSSIQIPTNISFLPMAE